MNLDTYTRGQLARFAIEEGARHGGVTNMLAIAQVLRNRVFAGWGDWIEVVERAPAKRATIYLPFSQDVRSSNVRAFLNRLDAVYTGVGEEDITGGALFYVEPNLPIEPWFKDEILDYPEQHQRVAHIGPIWFYK